LDELYHPDAEDNWLQYATFLLLYPSRRSTDYDRSFALEPLQDCKFDGMYSLHPFIDWRATCRIFAFHFIE
jgi:hypothetical protein